MDLSSREIDALRKTLNRHGHGFQARVAKECQRLRQEQKSAWWLDVSEFPVEVNGTHLHIDLLLRTSRAIIAAECKRANPALSTWCFSRSNFAERSPSAAASVVLQRVAFDQSANRVFIAPREHESAPVQYHVAVEVKSGGAGDAQGVGRGALDDAVNQALRGASGVVHAVVENPSLIGRSETLLILPAVITTARLVTCDTDLSEASLDAGELPENAQFSEKPWLWYRTFASANLRQSKAQRRDSAAQASAQAMSFGDVAAADYARSLAVVSVSGLNQFLASGASYHAREFGY